MKGYFRKRGDKWSFTVDIGRDPATGKRKQKTRTGFKTKKEAQAACAELLTEINKGNYVELNNQPIKEYMQVWLEVIQHKVKESTLLNYRRAINKWIIPQIGELTLDELKMFHAQNIVNQMVTEEKSPRYIEYIYTILHGAMEYAIKTGLLQKNPLTHVTLPRPRRIEYTTWSFEEVNRFLLFAKQDNPTYYMFYQIALKTGMRKGEILAVRWKDVNFETKTIKVSQNLFYHGPIKFTEPKTKESRRTIAIDDDLIKELKRHKASQNEFRLALGSDYEDYDLICCQANGNPLRERTVATHFGNTIKKAEVPKIRIHDMRHTHFTLLLQLGIHPKVVSERAGHSSVKITMDTYSHVTPNMQEETASKLNEAFKQTGLS